MNKKEKQKILKAMENIFDEYDVLSCCALEEVKAARLVKRYSNFFNQPCYGLWNFSKSFKKAKNERLTALALFMVAEKDVLAHDKLTDNRRLNG